MEDRESLPRLSIIKREEADEAEPIRESENDFFADPLSETRQRYSGTEMVVAQRTLPARSSRQSGRLAVRQQSQGTRGRTQTRQSRTRTRAKTAADGQSPEIILSRFVVQCGVCAIVLLTVFVLSRLDIPVAREAISGVREIVSMDMDFDDTMGQLKYVRNILPETAAVFFGAPSSEIHLSAPASGEVVQTYSPGNSSGIAVLADMGAPVYAAADGTVLDMGTSAAWGNYVRLDHGNNTVSIYGNLMEDSLPKDGDVFTSGDVIAKVGEGGLLHFELHLSGYAVDPLSYIVN